MHYGRASQPPAHPSVDPNSVACRRRAPFFLHRVYRSSSPGFYLSLSLSLFSDARARERLALAQSLSPFSLFLPLRYSRPSSFFFFLSLRRFLSLPLLVIPVRPLALLLLPPRCTPGRVERSLNSIGLLGGRRCFARALLVPSPPGCRFCRRRSRSLEWLCPHTCTAPPGPSFGRCSDPSLGYSKRVPS